jgi:hypothetical protein
MITQDLTPKGNHCIPKSVLLRLKEMPWVENHNEIIDGYQPENQANEVSRVGLLFRRFQYKYHIKVTVVSVNFKH